MTRIPSPTRAAAVLATVPLDGRVKRSRVSLWTPVSRDLRPASRVGIASPSACAQNCPSPPVQSTRSASSGSTPVARVTGTMVAAVATRIITPAAPAMCRGLKVLMP